MRRPADYPPFEPPERDWREIAAERIAREHKRGAPGSAGSIPVRVDALTGSGATGTNGWEKSDGLDVSSLPPAVSPQPSTPPSASLLHMPPGSPEPSIEEQSATYRAWSDADWAARRRPSRPSPTQNSKGETGVSADWAARRRRIAEAGE